MSSLLLFCCCQISGVKVTPSITSLESVEIIWSKILQIWSICEPCYSYLYACQSSGCVQNNVILPLTRKFHTQAIYLVQVRPLITIS